MDNNVIPDNCFCGGQLQYMTMAQGEEFYMCTVCSDVFSRYIDTIGG